MQGKVVDFPGTAEIIRELADSPVGDRALSGPGRLLLASLQASAAEIARISANINETVAAVVDATTPTSQLVGNLARDLIPRWHFAMLNDIERNGALATAVERQVKPGDHVLDIGAGTGLLAMMAANAGAAKVISCEANPLMAEIATQVVAAHGLSDVITVVAKRSDELVVGRDLERPVDVIVSEIVDCGLIGEGIMPTMRHAREHLLAPGGILMPPSARIHGALLQSPVIAGLNEVHNACGFDIGVLNTLSTVGHFPVRLHTWPHTLLSEATELVTFDFVHGSLDDGSTPVALTATADGTVHGVVAWFDMDLGAGVVLRNAPDNKSSHWMQAMIPLAEPIEVVAGQPVKFDFVWESGRLSVSSVS
ncbi:Protein arginine N-methyltransferase [Kitasatospora sp. MMS16-BH015]|uniref:50S ribosomal protein L11 methyltransferase n=1 Tax=Kitasatospora sp. MMS16-BH015 TaxID=2018025 RepID=UPI000CA0F745|nr:50S ribosomal protein L11 methyltransferase [Kitasatospora sp. MMS16-BH015]AUG77909.1 Protein arginine N-methyltransferase [Kitasatospora sp. MMS16-BH015]